MSAELNSAVAELVIVKVTCCQVIGHQENL